MPTALGVLPSNEPSPNGRLQVKLGGANAEGHWAPENSGLKVYDGAGGYMEISYTPRYACHWIIRVNLLARCINGINGNWQRWDCNIRISPADVNGWTLVGLITKGHDTVGWISYNGRATFRLAAGVTYTCSLESGYQSTGISAIYWGPEYLRLIGRAVGEGVL